MPDERQRRLLLVETSQHRTPEIQAAVFPDSTSPGPGCGSGQFSDLETVDILEGADNCS
jgi:hypothetical protein